MRLNESIKIHAPASIVWDAVSKPDNWSGFVSKIQEVEKLDDGFYRILIGNKEVVGKIAELENFRFLKFAGQLADQSRESEFFIEYRLEQKAKYVFVTEVQDFHIPFPFSLLATILFKFGKPRSKTNLQILKELCEN